MYFPLEVNEQLATAMRAAAEFKSHIDILLETIFKDGNMPKQKDDFEKMTDGVTDMICTIGDAISNLIAESALSEVNKQVSNLLNANNHVSE